MVPAACAQLCASRSARSSAPEGSRSLSLAASPRRGTAGGLTTPGEFHRPEVVPASAHGKSCPALPAWPGILRDHEPDALARPGEALGPSVIMRVRVPGALTRPQPASSSHVPVPFYPSKFGVGSHTQQFQRRLQPPLPPEPSAGHFCLRAKPFITRPLRSPLRIRTGNNPVFREQNPPNAD